MNTIYKLVEDFKKQKLPLESLSDFDLYYFYKTLSKQFPKEYLDLIFYEEFEYICNKQLSTKRDHQETFRKQLVEKYKRCLITGDGELMCEACHIKPFAICSEDEQYDINNGLLLNASFHKLFDNFMISINPESLELEISGQLDKDIYSNVWKYQNKKVILDTFPKNNNQKKYLEYHYQIFYDINFK